MEMTDCISLPMAPQLMPCPPPDDEAHINTPPDDDALINTPTDDDAIFNTPPDDNALINTPPDDDDSSFTSLIETEIIPARRSIYPSTLHPGFYRTHITPYNPLWPTQFTAIATHLSTLFRTSTPPAAYTTIAHIGSTAIPSLCAKPNIDILVTLPSQAELHNAIAALNWEIPTSPPFTRYTRCPHGGGVAGRESFKLYVPVDSPYYLDTPERSVYLINANARENPAGQVQIRIHKTVREVLMDERNRDVFEEYARVKWGLSEEVFGSVTEYARRKDGVVRRILIRGGWTDEEVDEKERLGRREVLDEGEEPY